MAISYGYKGSILGIGQNTGGSFGTVVARTKFIEFSEESTTKDQNLLEKTGNNQLSIDKDDTTPGRVTAGGSVGFDARYEGNGIIYYNALGGVSSAEVASFTVIASGDNQNNKIDFKEDGGSELTATLTAGTYAMGANSGVASSLCLEIKTQLEAAGAGTYTVTFAAGTTYKISVAVATGATAVQFLTDGTNASDDAMGLLGFTSNSLSASSITADTALTAVYDHTISMSDDLPNGELSLEVDVDTTTKVFEGCRIDTLDISVENDGFEKNSFTFSAEDMNLGSVTSATLSGSPLVVFDDFAFTYNSTTYYLNNFNMSLNNALNKERYKLGSKFVKEQERSSIKRAVTGSFELDFEGTSNVNAFYDDMISSTTRAITLTATGPTAKTDADGSTTYTYTKTITAPYAKVISTTYQPGDAGLIPQTVNFKALDDASAGEFNIVLRNTLSTVTEAI